MKKILFLFLLIIAGTWLLAGCSSDVSSADYNQADKTVNQITPAQPPSSLPLSSMYSSADKVQVFLFHATQRCTTCIAIGKLAGDTVSERFQDELKSGRIEFREVNIDLPENKALARKFQASGSSLYLNAIRGETDNIEQDIKVWNLTGNPAGFKNYLEAKINNLLGK